jgi:coenzyme PQQ precursor peptide PqqA
MNYPINAYSQPTLQNTHAPNFQHEIGNSKPVTASLGKPTAIWESPTVETFDLCMEVTAYFQQGK